MKNLKNKLFDKFSKHIFWHVCWKINENVIWQVHQKDRAPVSRKVFWQVRSHIQEEINGKS